MDFYKNLEALGQELARNGLQDQADTLAELVDSGATGSEILMGVRHHLRTLELRSGDPLAKKVDELLAEIDQSLG